KLRGGGARALQTRAISQGLEGVGARGEQKGGLRQEHQRLAVGQSDRDGLRRVQYRHGAHLERYRINFFDGAVGVAADEQQFAVERRDSSVAGVRGGQRKGQPGKAEVQRIKQ